MAARRRRGLTVATLGVVGSAIAALAGLVLYGAQQLTRTIREAIEQPFEGYEQLPRPEEVEVVAPDGLRTKAWWFPSPDARAAVIACHGHGGSKGSSVWMASEVYPDFHVLLLDVRGHGESPGEAISVGYLERLDVIGGAEWLVRQRPGEPIAAYGVSMGAVACILAAADCPLIAAVVADSPFDRLSASVRQSILGRGYPAVLARTLPPLIQHAARYRLGLHGRPWLDPLDVVGRLTPRPLLILHGEADDLTPVAGARALYAAAGEPKELWIEPGVAHAQLAAVQPAAYQQRVLTFLHRWLDVPASGTTTDQALAGSNPSASA